MPQKIPDQTGFFTGGCDSRNKPAYIGQNNYVWGINGLHRGGIFRTRPGFREAVTPPVQGEQSDLQDVQGGMFFQPTGGSWYYVMAYGGLIYAAQFPFTQFNLIPNLRFWPYSTIIFEQADKFNKTNPDGSLTAIANPYSILMIQDGITPCGYWDGKTSGHLRRNSVGQRSTPIGQAMKSNGDRLWVGSGNNLHGSNLGDPLAFTEEQVPATGGFFTLPGDITCIGETPDLLSLMVFTEDTTTTFQSGILDRTQWPTTPGFQRQLFDNIGAVGPKAFINQYGVSYWYSHNGLIQLDLALQTYRTRRLKYSDYGMDRSKRNLFSDLSGVCLGNYENFLFIGVPSGSVHNSHIWMLDETTLETNQQQQPGASDTSSWAGIWTGIRPVEFSTAVINGQNRCFALSRDYGSIPQNYLIGIWEMFSQQRADVQLNGSVKRITCGFETRKLAVSAEVKKISAIEWVVSEQKGKVDWTIKANGLIKTGFFPCGTKTTYAGEGPWGTQQITSDMQVGGFLRQNRLLRTEEILQIQSDLDGVETPNIPSVDLGFGVYIQWVGDAAIDTVRIFADAKPEWQLGRAEPDETTYNIVEADGTEGQLNVPLANAPSPLFSGSSFVDSISQYFTDPFYSSR